MEALPSPLSIEIEYTILDDDSHCALNPYKYSVEVSSNILDSIPKEALIESFMSDIAQQHKVERLNVIPKSITLS